MTLKLARGVEPLEGTKELVGVGHVEAGAVVAHRVDQLVILAGAFDRAFNRFRDGYGRMLDRSLDYRPITGLFALTILGLVGFLYMHTSKELAPEEDQGIVFAVTKAPKYANIDYIDFYGEKLDKSFSKFPETDLRFVLNGINGHKLLREYPACPSPSCVNRESSSHARSRS